jgi:hypothetical protein
MKIFYRIRKLIKLCLLNIKIKDSVADFADEYKIVNEIVEKIGIIPSRERERQVIDIAACKNLLYRYFSDERIFVITGDNFQNGKWRGDAKYKHC